MGLTPKAAIDRVDKYLKGLRLPYRISYGTPTSDEPEAYYDVPVILRRGNSALRLEISVTTDLYEPRNYRKVPDRKQLLRSMRELNYRRDTFAVDMSDVHPTFGDASSKRSYNCDREKLRQLSRELGHLSREVVTDTFALPLKE